MAIELTDYFENGKARVRIASKYADLTGEGVEWFDNGKVAVKFVDGKVVGQVVHRQAEGE